ncbi:MAG: menaquinone biosynthesis protein [Selenomonadaceae bacterium]|nr:menaquinone biosynthesis protein [Selenomonadaceae bacterium]
MRVNVGHINFLNVLPLNYFYATQNLENFALTFGVPAFVNAQIKNNLLDVSLISSIEYARQSQNLLLIPKICIRADEKVTSIILASRKPIDELGGERVAITSKSATAHCLLKIILAESYKLKPEYVVENLNVENPVPDDSTAALFIGDDALYLHLHRKNFFYYDLGEEWRKLTGRQMVYAVWAARESFAQKFPDDLRDACKKIYEGLQFGLREKSAAINSVLDSVPFTFDELDEYLGGVIKWDLTAEGIDALKIFYELAHKNNLLDAVPQIKLLEEF